MSETPTPLASRPNPDDDAVREARHQVLRELLGAYADRELPPETTAQIDAHLIGCTRCRRELDVHDALRARLAAAQPAAPSPALRARITAALDATPAPIAAAPVGVNAPSTVQRHATWLALAGWAVAVLLAVVLAVVLMVRPELGRSTGGGTRRIATPVHAVPLLNGILDDYRRVSGGDLPGRARDLSAVRAAVSFPIEPLRAPNLRLLGAWTTELSGEPAAVLAYRLDDRLVVQYLVAEDAFFRHPAIRMAVADHHLLTAADENHALVAWPDAATGTVLLGDVPPRALHAIWTTERTR